MWAAWSSSFTLRLRYSWCALDFIITLLRSAVTCACSSAIAASAFVSAHAVMWSAISWLDGCDVFFAI